jgi:hypothetical protein
VANTPFFRPPRCLSNSLGDAREAQEVFDRRVVVEQRRRQSVGGGHDFMLHDVTGSDP